MEKKNLCYEDIRTGEKIKEDLYVMIFSLNLLAFMQEP